jgi:hypothetical protein
MAVVVLENRNLVDVQANPYFASLAARGRLLTNYLTIANPSQPNYVALNFGDTMGVTDNGVYNIPGRNIVDLLEEAGVSWKTYHEAYPGNCYAGYYPPGNTLYARKHNAFISADTVRNNATRCAKIQNELAFEADIAAGTVPSYTLYVPDENNSSHDTSIAYAATWLQAWLEPKLANPSLKDVLWVITWDEGSEDGPIPISTILIGPGITGGTTDAMLYNHYSLLRTTQQFFGLGSLGRGDAVATPIALGGAPVATQTATSTATPAVTPTATQTPQIATPTLTATFLPLITATATLAPTASATPTPTRTATTAPTPTRTATPGAPMAFGSVPVVDTFTGADGALPAEWVTDAINDGASALRIVSNQVAAVSGGAYSSSRLMRRPYDGNKQALLYMATLPESPRYASIGWVYTPGASADGYIVEYRVGTGNRIFRVDNTVATALGATVAWSPATGDGIGIRVDEKNGVVEFWTYSVSSGLWTQQFTRSDGTYKGVAYPYVYLRGTNIRGDNFAAGSEEEISDMIDSGGVVAFAR